MTLRRSLFAAAAFALVPALQAHAAATVAQDVPPVDACVKTVDALGSSMSHKADTGPDGKPIYRFVLRTSGLDYDVVCDAATGVVGDVTPRMAH
jgi:hypothetical protein